MNATKKIGLSMVDSPFLIPDFLAPLFIWKLMDGVTTAAIIIKLRNISLN